MSGAGGISHVRSVQSARKALEALKSHPATITAWARSVGVSPKTLYTWGAKSGQTNHQWMLIARRHYLKHAWAIRKEKKRRADHLTEQINRLDRGPLRTFEVVSAQTVGAA